MLFVSHQQEEFLKDLEYVRASIILKNVHDDFLRTIKEDNRSEAIGIVIDKYMKQTKMMILERYLLYGVFAICVIILVSLILPLV